MAAWRLIFSRCEIMTTLVSWRTRVSASLATAGVVMTRENNKKPRTVTFRLGGLYFGLELVDAFLHLVVNLAFDIRQPGTELQTLLFQRRNQLFPITQRFLVVSVQHNVT